MARSKRASARREVLRRIKRIKETASYLQEWWTAETTVWEFDKRDEKGNIPIRPREEEEYPENQRYYWRSTLSKIDDLITELDNLRDYCVTQYHLTPEEN